MINIRACFSRNSVFRKLQLFDSHAPISFSLFSDYRPYHREISEKVEDRFRKEDSVDKDYYVVYRAPYVNYLRFTYAFTSISTSIVVPIVGSTLVTGGIGNYPVMLGDVTILNDSIEFTALIGVIILVIGQISYVVFKFPFRIYRNASNGKYLAIYQHLFPWKRHKEEFCPGEVKKVVKGYSIWKECLYEINNKKTILLQDHFYLPQDFNDMFPSNDQKGE